MPRRAPARSASRAVGDLRGIAGEFLAQRQRRRVLQMGAADLDDVVPRLAPWSAARRAAGRAPAAAGRVTARAAAMCSAVGKLSFDDWPLLTCRWGGPAILPPRVPVSISLARPAITSLTFMLDWVPRAGLPDDERELVVELARDDLRRRLLDRVGDLGVERRARGSPAPPPASRSPSAWTISIGIRSRGAEREILDRPLRSARPNRRRREPRSGRTNRFRCGCSWRHRGVADSACDTPSASTRCRVSDPLRQEEPCLAGRIIVDLTDAAIAQLLVEAPRLEAERVEPQADAVRAASPRTRRRASDACRAACPRSDAGTTRYCTNSQR